MWENVFIILIILLALAYSFLILYYKKWFQQLKEFHLADYTNASITFSIIIPARNEALNIANCLQSIINQNYPKELFEVIVINDHSTDNTSEIVQQFQHQFSNIKLIELQHVLQGRVINAYKKRAIENAIQQATGKWIITTDADCFVQPNWLKLYNDFIIEKDVVFVAAPVMFKNHNSMLSNFQFIDFMALQITTAAAVAAGFHSMCNGANLAYNKNVYFEVDGFKGIDKIASGDDMLLMNKIKKLYPKRIGYLFSKEAIVLTEAMPSWKQFFNQRIRWASKSDQYSDATLLPALLLVYLFNLLTISCFFIGLFKLKFLLLFLLLFSCKILVEWLFIKSAFNFFGRVNLIKFILLQTIHIVYIIIAGWLGKFGTYTWKERGVK